MTRYHFEKLIDKYSTHITVIAPPEERYEHGRLVRSVAWEKQLFGAVVPMPNQKVYQAGGYYSASDRQLYLKTPLPKPVADVKIRHKNQLYKVEAETDYSDFGDVYVYVLKWVSSFDEPEKN